MAEDKHIMEQVGLRRRRQWAVQGARGTTHLVAPRGGAAWPSPRCNPPAMRTDRTHACANARRRQLAAAHDEVVQALLGPIRESWREIMRDRPWEAVMAFVHAVDWTVRRGQGRRRPARRGGGQSAAHTHRPHGEQLPLLNYRPGHLRRGARCTRSCGWRAGRRGCRLPWCAHERSKPRLKAAPSAAPPGALDRRAAGGAGGAVAVGRGAAAQHDLPVSRVRGGRCGALL
jgi:hypothetical protein